MRNLSIARSPLSRLGLAIALTVVAGASQADGTQADMKGIWSATGNKNAATTFLPQFLWTAVKR